MVICPNGRREGLCGSLSFITVKHNRAYDEKYIKRPNTWEAMREMMGKLPNVCLGRNPDARKGGGSTGN